MATSRVFTTDLGILKNFPQTLADAVNGVAEDTVREKLRVLAASGRFAKFIKNKEDLQIKSFRTVLESFAPVIYLIDYNQLRKELEILKQKATELQKRESKGVFEEEIKSSLSFRDEQGLNDVVDTIIEGVKAGVAEFLSSSKPRKISYKRLAYLYSMAGQFGREGTTLQKRYPFELTGNLGLNVSGAYVFKDYDEASDKLGRRINKNVADLLKKREGVSKLRQVLILGHAAAKTVPSEDEEIFYASTPKLVQVLLDKVLDSVLQPPNSLPAVEVESVESQALKFLQDTAQTSEGVSVEVDKNFASGFLQIFVKIGGQILRGESAINNNIRSAAEKTGEGTNSEVLNKLRLYYRAALDEVNASIDQTVAKVLVESLENVAINAVKSQSSPSLISYFEDTIQAIFDGKKNIVGYSKVGIAQSKNKLSTSSVSKAISKTSTAVKKNKKISAKPVSFTVPTIPKSTLNLQLLILRINSNLHDQIRRNMGTGNSKNVLNYRTGRFAQSVKVEKMSESRQGMITAFYSYMKNPYATFSEGGRQQYPRSRDPKTLISKSIREIAGSMISNRLRAVNV